MRTPARPARLSETRAAIAPVADPDSTNRPGRRSRSTVTRNAGKSSGTRWASSPPDSARVILQEQRGIGSDTFRGPRVLQIEGGEALQFVLQEGRLAHLAGAEQEHDGELLEVSVQGCAEVARR